MNVFVFASFTYVLLIPVKPLNLVVALFFFFPMFSIIDVCLCCIKPYAVSGMVVVSASVLRILKKPFFFGVPCKFSVATYIF